MIQEPATSLQPAEDPLAELEQRIGYCFLDRRWLRQALTHRSHANERGDSQHYERLEFLGDSVLGLVAASWLYHRHPEMPEGELAKLKSYLVSSLVLGQYARRIELGPLVLLGVGEERSGGRNKTSILADATEALFCAIYLDGGLAAARQVVEVFLEEAMAAREVHVQQDAKTRLQELAQAQGLGLPSYELVAESGPDHDKEFTIECRIAGEVFGRSVGKSKKNAEQGAATGALERLVL